MLIKRIPDGPEGIAETVTAILALAHDPNTTNQIRDIALYICKKAGAKTEMEKARAIFNWSRKNVAYVKDPIYREFVQPPLFLLKQGMKKSHKAAGDCFVKGTRVLRKRDYKLIPIELLEEGDYIWGYKKWSKVTKIWGDKGRLPTTLIKLNNGSSVRLTQDHKVWIAECKHVDGHSRKRKCSCKMENRTLRRIKISELEKGMVVIQPDKIDFGENSIDPDRMYINGLYLSDGWCEDYRFAISGKDGSKKENQKKEVQDICERLNIKTNCQKRFIRVYDREWTKYLSKMGTVAYEKHAITINWEESCAKRLLDGILADSGKNTNGNGRTFTTTSEELWLQTRVLLKMFGIPCSERYIVEHGGLGKNPIWRLGIRDINRKDGKNKLFRVKEIIRDGKEEDCFDIETEDHFVWLPEADWTTSQCDDHTGLNMALLGALGFATRAVVSEDPTRPGNPDMPMWAHIYCEVEARKHPKGKRHWVPVDSSMWFLKFGEKVGGRQTLIYPGDIHPDLYFQASREGRSGLGFVSKAIELGSPYIADAMRRRTSKGGLFNFGFTVNGIDGVNKGLGGWGLLTPVISAGSSIAQALIGKRLQEKLAKRQGQLEQAKLNAQVRLAEQAQKLEFQAQQLNAERAALIQSEEAAFDRLRSASQKDRITAAALVGIPLAGIFVLNWLRRKKEKK